MGRWEPNAQARLQQAAMELFHERGYDRTTVEEIAARAGLTERTFFRYFADKREVLFSGSKDLKAQIVEAVAAAPRAMAPLDAVVAALEGTAAFFEDRHAHARKRQALITEHAELRERELIKLAAIASAVAEALRARGIPRAAASLIAETGLAIFKNAFERWIEDARRHDLSHHVRAALAELRLVTSRTPTRARRSPRRIVGPTPK
jgi:AcrR family transcriptional regulator